MILVSQAPAWAEGPDRPPVNDTYRAGSWKPDVGMFRQFATAIATRYSGNFVDPAAPGAGPLPRVSLWEVWAEPNLFVDLNPQYENGRQFAAAHYRRLLNAFFAPPTRSTGATRSSPGAWPPTAMSQAATGRGRSSSSASCCASAIPEAAAAKCPTKPRFDVLADNPINLSGGPRRSAIDPDDASSADLGAVAETLRAAERGNTIGTKGKHELWAHRVLVEQQPARPRRVAAGHAGALGPGGALPVLEGRGQGRGEPEAQGLRRPAVRGRRHRPLLLRRHAEALAHRVPLPVRRRTPLGTDAAALGARSRRRQARDRATRKRRLAPGGRRAREGGRGVHRRARRSAVRSSCERASAASAASCGRSATEPQQLSSRPGRGSGTRRRPARRG